MPKKLLTEKFCASVKLAKDAKTKKGKLIVQIDYFDQGHPALAFRVGHREKAFRLYVREQVDGKRKMKPRTLGRYPEMTLAEAREAWRMHRKAVSEGKVLVAVTSGDGAPEVLVSDVVAQWYEGWQRDKRPNSVKQKRLHIKSEILPAWGPRDIGSISKHDVMSLLDGIANRGATTQARRVFATLQTFFKWCRKRDVIAVNPMEALERKDFGSEESRDRVLSTSELAKLLAHIRGANHYDPFLAATHFLALSGNRPEEVGALRWDEIEADVVAFPGARMKNKLPFDLPITPHLKAIIDSAPRIDGCPFVFTTDGKRPLRGWDKAKKKIDKATGLEGWQFRDLRRTMATGMQRLGISEDVIEACSARLKTGVKKVYQRHLYAAEKRKAFERWAVENS
jgi:integrase